MIRLLDGETATLLAIARAFPFPRDYMVVDIETSGFSRNNDLIIAASWGDVRDARPGATDAVILNWFKTMCVDHARLRNQLSRIAGEFAKTGRTWHYPAERLMDEGVDPFHGLHRLIMVLHTALVNRIKIVGHNIWGFDFPFIDQAIKRFVPNYELPWCDDATYDTSLIEKALITGKEPWVGESLADWQTRAHAVACKKGQVFNLPTHCVSKYRLVERFNVDMRAAHRPELDILLCHYLFETYRIAAGAIHG